MAADRGLRRRFALGLGLALVLALGVEHFVFARTRAGIAGERDDRQGVAAAQALASLVATARAEPGPTAEPGEPPEAGETAGAIGTLEPAERLRTVVAELVRTLPEVESAEVVDIASTTLAASTIDPSAPRRLGREEKDVYDQAQRLRSNVETNRQEGGARKDEVEVEELPGGEMRVTAPVEQAGRVVASVRVVTVLGAAGGHPSWLRLLGFLLAPLAVLWLAAAAIGGRRWLMAALAAVLLVAAAGGYARSELAAVRSERAAAEEVVASGVGDVATAARQAAAAAGLRAETLEPSSWDVDRFRRPRGTLDDAGRVDRGRLAAVLDRAASRLVELTAWLLAGCLLLLLFVGLGGASRLGSTLARHKAAYFYVLPAILAMLVLVFFPFFYGIALSFTDANPVYNAGKSLPEIWVGFDNYVDILSDVHVVERTPEGLRYDYQNFYWTLGFTLLWTVSNVAYGVTLGLALALILNIKGIALRPLYRVLLILPWAVPNYITALIWRGMFHRQFGVINQIVQLFGGQPLSWFESPLTSFFAVLSTNGWLSFPFMMVISLGALQSIPADLYEAARVDGATLWQQFRSITLPSLKPALVPAIILSVIWTFNMFNIIYLTSQGEPGHATEILITEAYKIAFEQYRYGYAAAYSTIIFLILLVYGIWQNRVTRATEAIG